MKMKKTPLLIVASSLVALSAPASMAAILVNSPFVLVEPDMDNDSFATAPSASGAVVTISQEVGGEFPAFQTNFTARMSQIGDSVSVSFDIEFGQTITANNRSDFRLSLFDTVAGSEIIGFTHLGQNLTRTDFMRLRIDQDLSNGQIGSGGGSHDSIPADVLPPGEINNTGSNQFALFNTGIVHTLVTTIERIGMDTHQYNRAWTNSAGTTTFTLGVYNESSGDVGGTNFGDDAWGGGNMDQLNGFAIALTTEDPFTGSGTYTVSNFQVTGTAVPEPSASILMLLALSAGLIRRRRV